MGIAINYTSLDFVSHSKASYSLFHRAQYNKLTDIICHWLIIYCDNQLIWEPHRSILYSFRTYLVLLRFFTLFVSHNDEKCYGANCNKERHQCDRMPLPKPSTVVLHEETGGKCTNSDDWDTASNYRLLTTTSKKWYITFTGLRLNISSNLRKWVLQFPRQEGESFV